jgi:hypothetical protein
MLSLLGNMKFIPCSQKPVTGLCPEREESIWGRHILHFKQFSSILFDLVGLLIFLFPSYVATKIIDVIHIPHMRVTWSVYLILLYYTIIYLLMECINFETHNYADVSHLFSTVPHRSGWPLASCFKIITLRISLPSTTLSYKFVHFNKEVFRLQTPTDPLFLKYWLRFFNSEAVRFPIQPSTCFIYKSRRRTGWICYGE